MTFAEILSDAYEDLNYASSPAAAVVTRLKKYANQGLRSIVGMPGMGELLDSDAPYTFASVASTARYVLPESIAFIRSIHERTNDFKLEPMTMDQYRRVDADSASNSGTPERYVPFGRTAVATQPSDASELFIKSTSAGDTGTAYVEGIITGGYVRTANVAMTGVTAVSLNTAITSFIQVTDVYLSANAVGTVTLHEDSGAGTELARITIGQKRPRYFGFYLWPTPASAITYYVDYRRELVELVNDTDEPPLPTDFHYVLPAYIRWREYEKTSDSRAVDAKELWFRGLKDLKTRVQFPPDRRWIPGEDIEEGSNLGANYPSGRW